MLLLCSSLMKRVMMIMKQTRFGVKRKQIQFVFLSFGFHVHYCLKNRPQNFFKFQITDIFIFALTFRQHIVAILPATTDLIPWGYFQIFSVTVSKPGFAASWIVLIKLICLKQEFSSTGDVLRSCSALAISIETFARKVLCPATKRECCHAVRIWQKQRCIAPYTTCCQHLLSEACKAAVKAQAWHLGRCEVLTMRRSSYCIYEGIWKKSFFSQAP